MLSAVKLTAVPDTDDEEDNDDDDDDGLFLVEKVVPAQQYPNNLRLAGNVKSQILNTRHTASET